MAHLNKKQIQEWAKLLYTRENLSQKEIASKVGVTEKTIGAWKEKEKWDILKANLTIGRQDMLLMWYAQINELNNKIKLREEGMRYATSKESDTLVKLASAINQLEIEAGISDRITTFIDFINWLRPHDLKMAQAIVQLQDQYIQSIL